MWGPPSPGSTPPSASRNAFASAMRTGLSCASAWTARSSSPAFAPIRSPPGGVVTHLLKVRVPDVDAAFARARDFGARVVGEPTTYEYGERSGVLEGLGGHRWELTQSVRDVEPEEWGGVTVAPW